MTKEEFRHNFVIPLSQHTKLRDELVRKHRRHCLLHECEKAKETINKIDALDKKISKIFMDIELDVMNALPDSPADSIVMKAILDKEK